MNKQYILFLGIISIIVSGCASPKMYDKTYRTNILREKYPPEKTSRDDIHKAIQSIPDLFERRPEAGWDHHKNDYLGQKIYKIENTSNKKILIVERYILPDPRSSFDFLSLCRLWFYYDLDDRIVDVEWEYQSD